MARKWSKIRPVGPSSARSLSYMEGFMAHTVVISVDNIAKYWCEIMGGQTIRQDDFPNIAPLAPLTWYEYKIPKAMMQEEMHDTSIGFLASQLGITSMGFLMSAVDIPQEKNQKHELVHANIHEVGMRCGDDVKWLLDIEWFIELHDGVRGPIGGWSLVINPDGSPAVDLNLGEPGLGCAPYDVSHMTEEEVDSLNSHFMKFVGPVLMAISFAHCVNVEKIMVEPPSKVVKKSMKRYDVAPTTFYTLYIKHIQEMLRRAGSERGVDGMKQALHFCRGHFKQYTEEAPLFGKHTGLWHWGGQYRGNRNAGKVEKDYKIGV